MKSETGQAGQPFSWLLGLGLGGLCLTGCANRPDARDPLLGIQAPAPAPAVYPASTPAKTTSLPATPVPGQTTNTNSALAGLNGGRPLFIAPPTPSALATSDGPPPVPGKPNTPPKVTPLPKSTPQPSIMTVGSVSAQQQIEDSLRAQLKAAGVVYHKVDNVPGGIRLTVMVPEPGTENTRLFEATASDYSGAVAAILQKIRQAKT